MIKAVTVKIFIQYSIQLLSIALLMLNFSLGDDQLLNIPHGSYQITKFTVFNLVIFYTLLNEARTCFFLIIFFGLLEYQITPANSRLVNKTMLSALKLSITKYTTKSKMYVPLIY